MYKRPEVPRPICLSLLRKYSFGGLSLLNCWRCCSSEAIVDVYPQVFGAQDNFVRYSSDAVGSGGPQSLLLLLLLLTLLLFPFSALFLPKYLGGRKHKVHSQFEPEIVQNISMLTRKNKSNDKPKQPSM